MGLSIDWVSAGIFLVAYALSQVRSIPARARYGILSVACGAIAAYRLRLGARDINLVFVGLAAALAVYYAVRAFQARAR